MFYPILNAGGTQIGTLFGQVKYSMQFRGRQLFLRLVYRAHRRPFVAAPDRNHGTFSSPFLLQKLLRFFDEGTVSNKYGYTLVQIVGYDFAD